MSTNNYFRFFLVLLIAAGFKTSAQTTFNYTGGVQSYTVPAGVFCLDVDVVGATGGQNAAGFGGPPFCIDSAGHGGRVRATLSVVPGQVLNIYVGGAGQTGVIGSITPGGYNGGGWSDFDPFNGFFPDLSGGGGGGASDIRIGGTALTDRKVVAGGGGGAGGNWVYTGGLPLTSTDYNLDKGGDGGGTFGEDGWDGGVPGDPLAGLGGTPFFGGFGGLPAFPFYGAGVNGSLGLGGDAGSGSAGGGGGGGYYGGGGGDYAGGGGGSSYTDPGISSAITHTQGYNAGGNGWVIVAPGGTSPTGAIVGPTTICMGSSPTYTNPTAVGTLSWSTSSSAIATIGAVSGILTPVSAGTCNITCTITTGCGSNTIVLPVTVNPLPASITGLTSVCVGNTTTLSSTTSGGTWSSVTPAIGTISTTGVFTGLTTGTTIISYTVAGCASTTIVTVNPFPPAITGPTSVCVGSTIALANTMTGGVWSSFTPAVGTISGTGVVGGVSAGTTTISYTVAGCAATTVISVNTTPAPITGATAICILGTASLSDPTPGGTWSSVSTAVGTINTSGVVTGLTVGTTLINYTVPGCGSASATVTVISTPAAISGPDTLCFSSTPTYTDATPGGVWGSISPSVATISTTGVLTPHSLGAVTITYSIGSCIVFKNIPVVDSLAQITGANTMCQGTTMVLSDSKPNGNWSTSNASIATASILNPFQGVVTGVGSGPVTILYSKSGCPARTYNITVNPAPASITGSTAICVGLGTTLSSATPGGIWISSNPLATISTSGVVTSSVSGITDTIYYILPLTGCQTMAVVNVGTPPSPITGTNHVCQGDTVTLHNITTGGVWSSTALATANIVGTSGLVTGVSAGVVVISYTLSNGCFATDSFTVRPLLPASINLSYIGDTLCSGDSLTIHTSPVNAGTPTFIWKLFSTIPFATTDDSLRYAPTHGDVVMCYMTTHGVCSIQDSVIDTIATNVYPNHVRPIVTIMTAHSDSSHFIGEIVTFNANVTYGGTAPTYQWYVNGVAVSGANSSTLALPIYREDTVWCVVNGNAPCQDIPHVAGASNFIIIHAAYLGVNDIHGEPKISLFPNPNTGVFTLSGVMNNTDNKAVTYEVSNMLGQVIYKGTTLPVNGLINEQISLIDLATGTYLMRVNTETGSQTFRFVVSK